MPALAVIELHGGTAELDDALFGAWHRDGDQPNGNRLRLAGPMDNGWRVVTLWDSSEQFQAFLTDRLHLTLNAGDGQPTITVWGIEKVHRFD